MTVAEAVWDSDDEPNSYDGVLLIEFVFDRVLDTVIFDVAEAVVEAL